MNSHPLRRTTSKDGYLDEGMRGFIVSTARRNVHRIANFEIEDLIQEGYLCYYRCRDRYVGKRGLRKRDGTPCRYLPVKPDAEARRHFQALVKTAINNRISTLALKQCKWETAISNLAREDQTVEQAWESVLPTLDEEMTTLILLKSAPKEIKQLFALLVDEVVDSYQKVNAKGRKRRETNNQYFCRLLGLEPSYDVAFALEKHFCGK